MDKFAVIFDMDGVLIDSLDYIWRSFVELLGPKGIHLKDSDKVAYLGRSLKDTAEIWKDQHGLEIDYVKFGKDAAELELEFMAQEVVEDKDTLRFVNKLKENSVPMAVGTASQKERAVKLLEILKLSDYFSALVTADDTQKHKPNPEIFLIAASKLKVKPSCCIVIEDSPSGILAAKNGGMRAVGMLTKYNSKEILKDADLVIKNFSELTYEKLQKLASMN